ncbi:MAG: MMPL family transporter [FCB group bacterium]|nr:MMPL family transporter [FCB group bacterium]
MRNRILEFLAEKAAHRTWLLSGMILIVTAILGVLASGLHMSPGFTDMLPENNPKGDEFNLILKEFTNASNIILVVQGTPEDMKAYARHITPRLEDLTDWVDRVDVQTPVDFYRKNALKLLTARQLDNFGDLFDDPNLIPFLTHLNESFEKEYTSDGSIGTRKKEQNAVRFLDGIETFTDVMQQFYDGDYTADLAKKAVDALTIGETYFISPDRDMMILMIEPTFNMFDDINLLTDAVNGIEKLVKTEAPAYHVTAGLTGSIVLSRDEIKASTEDSMSITLMALVGIFFLFVLSFRMWGSPFMAILTVILGVIWAMGIASLLVDSLSLMTVMMAVILVGLGIDFSIHIISAYTENRYAGVSAEESLRNSLVKTGPGIFTGGLTTGAAFLTMMISSNRGMFEFGFVAGSGIVVTMLATLIILPVLLMIREKLLRKRHTVGRGKDISYAFLGRSAEGLARHWIVSAVIILLVTIFLTYHASKITMDYNYLNMEPVGLESIKLQEDLIASFDLSTDYALLTASDLPEVRKLTEKARELSTAGWVESISDFLPDPAVKSDYFHFVRNLRRNLNAAQIKTRLDPQDTKALTDELERLEFNIIELQDLAYIGGQDRVYDKAKRLVGEADDSLTTGLLSRLVDTAREKTVLYKLTDFSRTFAETFKADLLTMANTEPLRVDLLPREIRERFIGKSGDIYLISVYPKQNVWEDTNFLKRFAADCEGISPKATGFPPIFVELLNIIAKDGKKSTWLAVAAVFLLLFFDFRNLKYALVGMVPLFFGAVWMVGFMQLSGLQFTMVNVMAIPLIIGIGIDDGVHILHRYRIEQDLKTVFRSTGKAVLLTSLTTMMGFGSLWFATYRGLGSMGIALFIGVGSCFLASVIIIPVILGMGRKPKVLQEGR